MEKEYCSLNGQVTKHCIRETVHSIKVMDKLFDDSQEEPTEDARVPLSALKSNFVGPEGQDIKDYGLHGPGIGRCVVVVVVHTLHFGYLDAIACNSIEDILVHQQCYPTKTNQARHWLECQSTILHHLSDAVQYLQ